MSGFEDIQQDPPDPPLEEMDDEGNDPGKEEITQPVDQMPAADSSDASSLTCSWTLLDEDEEDGKKKPESESGSSLKVLDQNDIRDRPQETDSDSIVTLSDDEILFAQSRAYCHIPDYVNGRTQESLISTISTVTVSIDGIPIKSQDDEDEEARTQYDWNSEEEREIPNDRVQEIQPSSEHESEHEEENEPDDEDDVQESEGVGHLEPGEPGYDLDDDGLPGAPLPPLPQEVELYPSQELDPSYQAIQKEKVYKHDKNLRVDHFLTAILVLALALVIGLGIGHFLGMFLSLTTNIDSRLFGLNPDPFEQEYGGHHSSDSKIHPLTPSHDLQRQTIPSDTSSLFGTLKNAFVRLGVKFGYYKKPQPHPDVLHDFHDSEEYYEFTCMTADGQPILVNNEPVTVSQPEDCYKYFFPGQSVGHASNLQPPPYFTEVAREKFKRLSERLEVQEMYDNLKEERLDNLQEDLVLCIEGDEGHGGDDQDLDDRVIKKLWEENQELRDQVYQMKSFNPKNDEAMAAILRDKINELLSANADLEREVAQLRYADAARGAAESVETLDKLRKTRDTLNDIVTENDQLKIEDEFDLPWPSKRKVEFNKNSDGPKNFNSKDSDNNFQKYLAKLLEMFSKDGTIDLKQSEKLVDGLKATLVVNFQDKIMSEKDLAAVISKFDDLKKFVNRNLMSSNMKSLKIASLKFLKSLLGAVKDIKEANEENSGKSWFKKKFAEELSEVKEELNSKWNKIFKKWKTVTAHDYSRGEDDVEDEDDEDRHPMNKNKLEYKTKKKQSNIDGDDYAEGHISKDEDNYYQKDKLYKRNHERKHHKGKHEKRDN